VSADPGQAKSTNCSRAELWVSTRRMYDTNDGRDMRHSTSRSVVSRVLPNPMVMVRKSSRCMLRQVTVFERAHARKVAVSPRSISATRSQMSLLSMSPEAGVDYSKIPATASAKALKSRRWWLEVKGHRLRHSHGAKLNSRIERRLTGTQKNRWNMIDKRDAGRYMMYDQHAPLRMA
jgi:hypothetical protein